MPKDQLTHLGLKVKVSTKKKLRDLADQDQRKLADYVRLVLEKHLVDRAENTRRINMGADYR